MESRGVRIGTCSWSARSLIESGAFYPRGVAGAEERLRFYAGHFDTVEVDSSYFAIPTPAMTKAWAERTPEKFLFHVKAFGALTGHPVDPGTLAPELLDLIPPEQRSEANIHVSEPATLRAMAQAFVTALDPLKTARRLGFVIFQFPPWFTYKNANRDYLLYCKELSAGLPIAVEFRHGSWLTRKNAGELLAFLREHKITYITCDEPQFGDLSSAPFRPESTTSMAYLRLHGRNAESWLNRSSLPNEYLYEEGELERFASEAERLAAGARTVFVMFNNGAGGPAVKNALRMRDMLKIGVGARSTT